MRCRGANVLRSTWAARTAISSSSSRAKSGTCFNSTGSQGIDHLVGAVLLSQGTPRKDNRPGLQEDCNFCTHEERLTQLAPACHHNRHEPCSQLAPGGNGGYRPGCLSTDGRIQIEPAGALREHGSTERGFL